VRKDFYSKPVKQVETFLRFLIPFGAPYSIGVIATVGVDVTVDVRGGLGVRRGLTRIDAHETRMDAPLDAPASILSRRWKFECGCPSAVYISRPANVASNSTSNAVF
jgi:hypothetical protein